MTFFGQDTISIVLFIFSVTAAFIAVLSAITASMIKIRGSRYDNEKMRVNLSPIRESYESKASDLAFDALATSDRWKEANHLLLDALEKTDNVKGSIAKPNDFLSSFGIKSSDIEVDPDLVFVLTPFSKEEQNVFSTIKSVCDATGYRAVRGDEENAEGDVLGHIVRNILRSRIVIANIGSRNPNVFYELGIAHALSKPTLLVSRTISDTPLDIQNRRIVIYNDIEDLARELALALLRINRSELNKSDLAYQNTIKSITVRRPKKWLS